MSGSDSKSDNWAKMENVVVILGTWSWLVVLVAAILDIVLGIYNLSVLGVFVAGWAWGGYAATVIGLYIWYLIAGAVELVLLFIYVLKTFVPKIKSKDINFLMNDSIFSPQFPKMLFFGILLMVFAPAIDYMGGALVIVPAILMMIFAPKSGSSAPAKSSKKAAAPKKEEKLAEEEPAPAEESPAEEEVKPVKKAAKRAKKAA